ncbi:hypothetical protein [Eoetvoesiella caeni]|uniref:Uncharacterized protein n=1 Tax=Eoetvoesiella caeni TaxID=645616 RepID=A0A366HAJ8_9BURK|nr:hypothetical protein [Eoetvoesiella caeni]MCI2809395.1 hypothetical protein [Eoetvoesiella caeni]NYT54536.1 hypothetical protein [Eoetvoesiella caeni]RBP39274.1 hypothetical protein DFR37_10565 [Eoetvoesiella caeni]
MIETDIDYPEGLPNPLREGHSLRPVSPFMITGMQSGRSRSRRAFTSVPTRGTWDFLFKTDNHAAAFEAWFRDAIHDGADWFNIERKTPLGLIKLVCKFTDVYTGPTLIGRSSWRFSCPLEVWERPLMPKDWGNFPWFVIDANIFDLAMNREWPES